ncbi:hypothetical protein FACS189483_08640 [Spirochaetia bacterium]|nr:hypothetical protein FACS189483_08640 [Spirochaetia bacterium]
MILVTIQFKQQRGFTHHLGSMTITGHYGSGDDAADGEFTLEGGLTILFGGMEFRIGDDSFSLIRPDGSREAVLAEHLTLSGNQAAIRFPGGASLVFTTYREPPELWITGSFDGEFSALELPYRPMRSSRIRDTGDGEFMILADGFDFSFGYSTIDHDRRLLILENEGPPISYRAAFDPSTFAKGEYSRLRAYDQAVYDEAVDRWRDAVFALWGRASLDTEELVTAYAGEAVLRGDYAKVVEGIPRSFLDSSQRTYASSVYLGQLDAGLRSFASAEREKSARLTQLLNSRSEDFFRESHVIAYCAIRGLGQFIDQGAALAQSLFDEAEVIPLPLIPGIFEGYSDWARYRPGEENPFVALLPQLFRQISQGIIRSEDGSRILVFSDSRGEAEFNLRLGVALDAYGKEAGRPDWAVMGRSLVLSTLSLMDDAGTFPEAIFPVDLETPAAGTAERISAALLYRYLAPINYPHDTDLPNSGAVRWAWTAATAVEATMAGDILDIAVTFPVGETHYLIVRGIPPFTKVQLYNMDYRTDPNFERYDSSGWSYSASERSLLLKVKHRDPVEHIRVFYTPASPPPLPRPAPPLPATETAPGA